MKNILSTVSLFLAFITLVGCSAKPQVDITQETDSETTHSTTQYQPQSETKTKSDKELLEEAKEVTELLLKHAITSDKIPKSQKEIYNNVFARIINYTVYKYISSVSSLVAQGKSQLYKDYIEVKPAQHIAIITRKNINKIVHQLFGLDALPATLISCPEFNKDMNRFEFKIEKNRNDGLDYTDMTAYFDSDNNIVVNFKLKNAPNKAHGFYRIIYYVMEENGERFLRFKVFYKV